MNKYDFTLVVSNRADLTEGLADALYSAGCDDATPGACEGVITVEFHREAASLEEAIRTAIKNVRTAGLEVDRVEIEEWTFQALRSAIQEGLDSDVGNRTAGEIWAAAKAGHKARNG